MIMIGGKYDTAPMFRCINVNLGSGYEKVYHATTTGCFKQAVKVHKAILSPYEFHLDQLKKRGVPCKFKKTLTPYNVECIEDLALAIAEKSVPEKNQDKRLKKVFSVPVSLYMDDAIGHALGCEGHYGGIIVSAYVPSSKLNGNLSGFGVEAYVTGRINIEDCVDEIILTKRASKEYFEEIFPSISSSRDQFKVSVFEI